MQADFYYDPRERHLYRDLETALLQGCIEQELLPLYRTPPEVERKMEWQPIESLAKDNYSDVLIHGYSICGQLSPTGPYRYYKTIKGTIDWGGKGVESANTEYPEVIEHPTHWMPMPVHPSHEPQSSGL